MPKKRPNEAMRKIGRVLRKYRILQGLSQADVGATLGVQYQQVQKYESGISKLPADFVAPVCERLRITPNILFGWERDDGPEKAPPEKAFKMAARFGRLSKHDQAMIEKLMGTLPKRNNDSRRKQS